MTTGYKAASRKRTAKNKGKGKSRKVANQPKSPTNYSKNSVTPKIVQLNQVSSSKPPAKEIVPNGAVLAPVANSAGSVSHSQTSDEPVLTNPRTTRERSTENKNLILLKPLGHLAPQLEEDEIVVSSNGSEAKPLEVLLITEGTYPFHWGGVSTWCHLLIRDLPEVNFTLFSMIADPQTEPRINLLPNVVNFIPVPLWGTLGALELRPDLSLGELIQRKQQTTEELIGEDFVPIFRTFLSELYLNDSDSERLGQSIHQMYRFFLQYDYDTIFHSQAVWNCFVEAAQEYFVQSANQHGYDEPEFTLWDVTQGLQWLYHWCFPLAKPIPRVDVAHASTAGISTMVGVVAKLEYRAAFLLSEHGIYLRERYIAEANSANSFFLKLLALRFARRMTDLSYNMSDQISPCCDYNQRWEIQNGVPPERLHTIYYGADADNFYAGGKPIGEPPVVVWVGRINPLKDVLTLLQAAALVHEERPDIQFKLFGSAPAEDQPYYDECLALHKKLGLEEVVIFAGYASNVAAAYNEGDVVLLSSISEGFPFATLEAMLCGKPVVATSVGGLPEQIEGCGVVVEPRNPRQMADGVLLLMNNAPLCADYGKAAREKALQEFSVHQSREAYLSSYLRILGRLEPEVALIADDKLEFVLAHAVGETQPYEISITNQSIINNWAVFAGPAELAQVGASSYEATSVLSGNTGGNGTIDRTLARRLARVSRQRLQLLRVKKVSSWEPRNVEGIRSLALEIMQRDAYPIDYLEISALLESLGITDEMSYHHYGAPNTFELAKVVLKTIRAEQAETKLPAKASAAEPAQSFRQNLFSYLQGPVALLSGLTVLLIIQAYSLAGQWAAGQIMALSLGLSSGLLMTNGFLQGFMRRASICLTLNNPRAACRFLIRGFGLAELCMFGIAGLVLLIAGWTNFITMEERIIFCLAFLALSTIWLVGGALTLIKAQIWLGISLGIGLIAGLLIDRLTAFFSEWHTGLGSLTGFAITLVMLFLTWWRVLARQQKHSKSERVVLPSRAYLFYEAAPYFIYGMLYVALITIPHVLGWFGKLGFEQSRQATITSLEVGLTLAMPPLILISGVAERTLRLFWLKAKRAQEVTPGQKIEKFSQTLFTFYRRQRRQYGLALGLFTIAYGGLIWWLLSNGTFKGLIGSNPEATILFFLVGVITFYLLGHTLFNCMFCIALARPGMAAQSVFSGVLVLFIVGIPFSIGLNYAYCVAAFIIGVSAFLTVSSRQVRQLLNRVDYYYFTAF